MSLVVSKNASNAYQQTFGNHLEYANQQMHKKVTPSKNLEKIHEYNQKSKYESNVKLDTKI